jgi:hypothetical protein
MEDQTLPQPVTTEQMYLAALLDELRTLNGLLQPKEKPQPSSDKVVLREPAVQSAIARLSKKGGKIR